MQPHPECSISQILVRLDSILHVGSKRSGGVERSEAHQSAVFLLRWTSSGMAHLSFYALEILARPTGLRDRPETTSRIHHGLDTFFASKGLWSIARGGKPPLVVRFVKRMPAPTGRRFIPI